MKTRILAVLALGIVLTLPTQAQFINSWSDGSGRWETTTNWSLGSPPSSSDSADFITNAGNDTITIDATTSGSFPATMTISNLTVSAPVGSSNTLFLNDAGLATPLEILNSLTIDSNGVVLVTNSVLRVDSPGGFGGGDFIIDGNVSLLSGSIIATNLNIHTYLGYAWNGNLTVSNGTALLRDVLMGGNSDSSGTMTIAGGTTSLSQALEVGRLANATGAVWVTGGLLTAGAIVVGDYSVGQMTVSNGTVLTFSTNMGGQPGSSGTLTVAGGTNSMSAVLNVGFAANATGAVWVTGGLLLTHTTNANNAAFATSVGCNGVGQIMVSNGTMLAQTMFVGRNEGSQGTLTVAGGSVLASNVFVGYNSGSQGTLTIAGGTNSLSSYLSVGRFYNATGAVWVTGGLLTVTNNATSVGDGDLGGGGDGQMTVSNGTWLARDVYVGTYSGGPVSSSLGGGTLTIAGGTSSVSSVFYAGILVNTTGTVWVTGGQLMVTNDVMRIGLAGSGQMTISNGNIITRDIIVGSVSNGVPGGGTLTIAGGTITVLSPSSGGFLAGDFQNATGTIVVAGGQLVATNSATVLGSLGVGQMLVSSGMAMTSQTTMGAGTNTHGSLAVSGGSMMVSSNLTAAPALGSTGDVAVTGGQLVVTNGVIGIGNDGTTTNGVGVGQITVSNGTLMASSILLGSTVGGQGNLTIQSGGSVSFPGSNSVLSVNSTNSLDVQGGAQPIGVLDMYNGTIDVGVGANGTMNLNGGIINCDTVTIGDTALGTCLMNDGTLTMSSALTVGNGSASKGMIWMNGGTWLSSSRATIGNNGVGQMTISNGTFTLPRVVVSGIGTSQNPGTFTIAGGAVFSTNLVVGFDVNSTGTVWVTAGNLGVTNAGNTAQLVVGRSGAGALTLSNGTVVVDQLLVSNLTKSTFSFVGGTLRTRNTLVTSGAQFVVGDGASPATLNLLGGAHTFANGLRVRMNAVLSGCGTINGTVVVDPGGIVVADCGGSLTFNSSVTNNGTMRAINGSTLEGYGPVVNNGIIDIIGGTTNFHSGFVNNGVIITPVPLQITSIGRQGNDIRIAWQSTIGTTNALQATAGDVNGSYSTNNFADIFAVTNTVNTTTNYLDIGGATNFPARYYRVRLVP